MCKFQVPIQWTLFSTLPLCMTRLDSLVYMELGSVKIALPTDFCTQGKRDGERERGRFRRRDNAIDEQRGPAGLIHSIHL